MTLKKNLFAKFVLVFSLAIIISSCGKKETPADCNELSNTVDTKISAYNANNSAANCQAVIAAYNAYINSDCLTVDEKSSYENERDAFQLAHCP